MKYLIACERPLKIINFKIIQKLWSETIAKKGKALKRERFCYSVVCYDRTFKIAAVGNNVNKKKVAKCN